MHNHSGGDSGAVGMLCCREPSFAPIILSNQDYDQDSFIRLNFLG